MKWKKPNGTILELNDNDANMKAAIDAGLEPVDPEAKDQVVVLYQRLKGEIVEGQPPAGKEVIIESDSFPVELVEDALKDGWYKTKKEAGDAPPDKPVEKES